LYFIGKCCLTYPSPLVWVFSSNNCILQINVDSTEALEVLHHLFESLAPIVFRPVDILLKTLLEEPHDLVSNLCATIAHHLDRC